MPPRKALRKAERATLANARLLALDVDGTLTDGRIVWAGATEVQAFHVHDGQALVWLARAGITVAWISGRGSASTEQRAKELGIAELHLRTADKEATLRAIQARLGVTPAETVAMGDDLPDLALARAAGLFAAPGDARPEVLAHARIVTVARGGRGAVRELAEHLLRARGSWEALAAASGP
jgi:3-deoxy-D-manno-octulosonate 8-phosphate phosphatase (KDO 8-P phosphatase)